MIGLNEGRPRMVCTIWDLNFSIFRSVVQERLPSFNHPRFAKMQSLSSSIFKVAARVSRLVRFEDDCCRQLLAVTVHSDHVHLPTDVAGLSEDKRCFKVLGLQLCDHNSKQMGENRSNGKQMDVIHWQVLVARITATSHASTNE